MQEDFVKITNAAYRIIDFFPDSDPLKNKAKEKVLTIMENLTLVERMHGWTSLKKEQVALKVAEDIDILENYLKLGRYQGWLDGTNFLILIKEYRLIKDRVCSSEQHTKTKELMSFVESVPALPSEVGSQTLQHNEPLVEKVKEPKLEPPAEILQRSVSMRQDPPSGELSARQRKILEMLKGRGKAQVADFIKELPNVTKRTVRRDLDELLKKGRIVRVGEWNQVSYQINSFQG